MLPINEVLEKIISKQKDDSFKNQYFLSLVVHERYIQAGIWNFSDSAQEGQCLSAGSWESWGGDNPEELIVAADTSIATAVSSLPSLSESQPTNVVLGVPESWVEGNEIKETKKKILETVCRKLLLKPLGFVVTPEAIAQIFRKQEGEMTNIILLNVDDLEIVVSLIIKSKYLGSQVVSRSNSLALDLEEGLLRFNYSESFPPRILLLGSTNLEEERQSLVSYPWVGPENGKKPLFLQIPKVEIAPPDFETKAVILATSKELAKSSSEKSEKIKTEVVETPLPQSFEKKSVLPSSSEESLSQKDLSFPEQDFGFVKGEDITLTSDLPSTQSIPQSKEEFTPEGSSQQPPPPSFEPPSPRLKKFSLSKFLNFIKTFFSNLFSFFLPLLKFFSKKGFLSVGLSLGILLSIFVLIFVLVSKVEVKILAKPYKVEKEFQFTVSPKTSFIDLEKKVIPVKEATVSVSLGKSASVQGTKIVGEKAKGEIVIYNGTTNPKTFAKGTLFKNSQNLEFVITQEVTIPGKTVDLNSTPPVEKWGEAKVSAEAAKIGTEYNIPVNTILTLSTSATSSSFLAKSAVDFIGGTSRQIQAVSKEDKENLKRELLSQATQEAKQQLKNQISPQDTLLEDSFKLKSRSENFDKEVGDEASQINLQATYQFSSFYFTNADWEALSEKLLYDQFPSGYSSQPFSLEKNFSLVKAKETENEYFYSAKIKAIFLPQINQAEVKKNLKGKLFSSAQKYLNSLPNLVGFDILFSPKYFAYFKLFPLKEKNIVINLEPF